MFISGPPSNRAHFPYQAGLRGNSSPPDPPFLSLPVRRASRPTTAQLLRIRVDVADQAVASGSTPMWASLASRTPPPLFSSTTCRAPHQPPPLSSYGRRARVHARRRHNTGSSLSSRLQPSRPPFPLVERVRHLATSPSATTRAVPAAVLEQLGRAKLAAPCFSVGRCSGEAPAPCSCPWSRWETPKTELSRATPPRGGWGPTSKGRRGVLAEAAQRQAL
jgi:hypothetical protein